MRKDNLIKLGDAISQMLKQERLDVKLSRFAIKNAWEEIAGKMVSNHTTQIAFDDHKTMFLQLDSAALKNEVMFGKTDLIKKINGFCGYELITNLVIR